MKYLVTRANINLHIEVDNIEKLRTEIAEYFGIKTKEIHLNYEGTNNKDKEKQNENT